MRKLQISLIVALSVLIFTVLYVLISIKKQGQTRISENSQTARSLYSVDKDIKVDIPPNVYSEALRFELSETLISANIEGYKSFRTVGLFGYTRENQPVVSLNEDVIVEYTVPDKFNSYSRVEDISYTYKIKAPEAFLYDKKNGWVKIQSKWEEGIRKLIVNTSRIGSLAFVIPADSSKTIKED